MKFIQKCELRMAIFISMVNILFSCSKEKTPTPATPVPTKWEKIAGHYKVFDTLGVYLYDMDLIHLYNESENQDSIRFQNFDDEFTFSALQVEFSSIPMYVRIGGGILCMIQITKDGK